MTIKITTAEALRIVSEHLSTRATGKIRFEIEDANEVPAGTEQAEPVSAEEFADAKEKAKAEFAKLRQMLSEIEE